MPDKERERHYLRALLRACKELPSAPIQEHEPPDFVLGVSPRRFGIEITTFHLSSPTGERPHQEQHALRERTVVEANRHYRTSGGPALYVSVYFNETRPLSKLRVRPLAQELSAAVASQIVPLTLEDPCIDVPWDHLPPEVSQIQVHGSLDGEDELWSSNWSGWVSSIQLSEVERIIRKKSATAERARRHCDSLWLVVVDDPFLGGAPAAMSDEALRYHYDHSFDRVVWFQPHGDRVCDIGHACP